MPPKGRLEELPIAQNEWQGKQESAINQRIARWEAELQKVYKAQTRLQEKQAARKYKLDADAQDELNDRLYQMELQKAKDRHVKLQVRAQRPGANHGRGESRGEGKGLQGVCAVCTRHIEAARQEPHPPELWLKWPLFCSYIRTAANRIATAPETCPWITVLLT